MPESLILYVTLLLTNDKVLRPDSIFLTSTRITSSISSSKNLFLMKPIGIYLSITKTSSEWLVTYTISKSGSVSASFEDSSSPLSTGISRSRNAASNFPVVYSLKNSKLFVKISTLTWTLIFSEYFCIDSEIYSAIIFSSSTTATLIKNSPQSFLKIIRKNRRQHTIMSAV